MAFRTFVVANPHAGAGQVEREWERIERLLRAKLPEFDYAFTEGPNHATLLTREALREGWEMIVAIGGDGTINEIANGFFEKVEGATDFGLDDYGWIQANEGAALTPINSDAVLGLLPMGTGGDFRRTVGVMGELQENIERLGGDETTPCDIGQLVYIGHDGRIASRCFINIASCGLSGEVDEVVNNMWKGFGGGFSYRAASTWAWFRYGNQPVDLRFDDGEERLGEKYLMVCVANGKYFGSGMHVAPEAEIDDGQFEVVILGDIGKLPSATLMTKIYDAKHFEFAEASRRQARHVQMRAPGDKPVLIDLDGEQPGRLPATFQMHQHALRLKV